MSASIYKSRTWSASVRLQLFGGSLEFFAVHLSRLYTGAIECLEAVREAPVNFQKILHTSLAFRKDFSYCVLAL